VVIEEGVRRYSSFRKLLSTQKRMEKKNPQNELFVHVSTRPKLWFSSLLDVSRNFIMSMSFLEVDEFTVASHPQLLTLGGGDGFDGRGGRDHFHLWLIIRQVWIVHTLFVDFLLHPFPVEADLVEQLLAVEGQVTFVLQSALVVDPVVQ
jgi:hypothetical protein